MKRRFQAAIVIQLLADSAAAPEMVMRRKLERWQVAGFPGANARRALRHLQALTSLVPPRVSGGGAVDSLEPLDY